MCCAGPFITADPPQLPLLLWLPPHCLMNDISGEATSPPPLPLPSICLAFSCSCNCRHCEGPAGMLALRGMPRSVGLSGRELNGCARREGERRIDSDPGVGDGLRGCRGGIPPPPPFTGPPFDPLLLLHRLGEATHAVEIGCGPKEGRLPCACEPWPR